jgi:signal transduction histidine kinase
MRAEPPSDEDDAPGALPAWRRETLKSMLGVAAVISPIAAVLAVLGWVRPRPVFETIVILPIGFTVPLLRIVPIVISYAVRAAVTMGIIFGAGVFVLVRAGLSPGAALLFAVASIFGALYFGRAVGFATVGFGALAFIVVGWLMSRGAVPPPRDIFNFHQLRNWVRVGVIFALFATLLTSGVAFVIGRVEAGARDLRVAYERLGLLHLRLESAKEEERRFLSRELHDEFGQLLTALKLRIQLDARGAAAPADGPDAIAVIDDLIARVRRMSGDLRPPLLDEVGLVPAVRAYLDMQATISGVAMSLEVSEPPEGAPAPDRDVEITCFRIVQEAVTNAVRHAAPRDLRVRLDRGGDRLALSVTDDGRGFEVGVRLEGAAAAGHLGVIGMRERVRAQGGAFRLRSRPGAGTTIEVELPLHSAPGRGPAAVPS